MMRITKRELKTLGFKEYVDNRVRKEIYADVYIEFNEDEGVYLSHYYNGGTIPMLPLPHINTIAKLNRLYFMLKNEKI